MHPKYFWAHDGFPDMEQELATQGKEERVYSFLDVEGVWRMV